MATLLAHITVKPGCEARFEAVARVLHATTHRNEDAVRQYDYWRGADPRTYYTLLAFDDHRGFIAHQTSDHHEAAWPILRDLVDSIRWEWLDPVDSASNLPPTETQSAPDDADELTMDYTDRYAAVVADWWLALRA